MVDSRNKGRNGELEFARYLQELFDLPETPRRNLDQLRDDAQSDFIVEPFIFEVKRTELLRFDGWWRQVTNAWARNKGGHMLERVVAFRQRYKPWAFLISADNIGLEDGYLQINEDVFRRWAQRLRSTSNETFRVRQDILD